MPCDGGPQRRRRQGGFTLLEVLVALAIAGLALAVMVEAATGGFFAVRTAAGYEEALTRAQSHLEALGVDGALIAGEAEGDDGGGYHWRYRITEAAGFGARSPGNPTRGPNVALLDVEVGVSWVLSGRRREVVLHTKRIGRHAERRDG